MDKGLVREVLHPCGGLVAVVQQLLGEGVGKELSWAAERGRGEGVQ